MSVAARSSQLSNAELDKVRTVLGREAAIQVGDDQEYLIETRLRPVARRLGIDSINHLIAQLDHDPAAVAAMIDAMTTNETLFFRDQHPFETIRDSILPEQLEKPRSTPITIWCAACSSGQEPYSLAMILLEQFPDLAASGAVRIVATDISPTMIARAEEGRYSRFEVGRGLPPDLLARYFTPAGKDWVVKANPRSLIDFRTHNLTESWSEIPRCDIVLMRNVLIYFTVEVKSQLLGRIRTEILRPGGALFLGSSETTISVDEQFSRERHGRSVLYRMP